MSSVAATQPLSLLTSRGDSGRWSIGLVVSIAAHVAMFGGALLYARITPPHTVAPQPIMAKLVRLGKPRPDNMLPRLSAPTRAPEASHHAEIDQPSKSSAKAVPVPAAPAKPASTSSDDEAEARAKEALARQRRLSDALAKLGAPTDGPTSPKGEAPAGQEDGSMEGTADKAALGDQYAAEVVAALRRNFVLPTTISDKEKLYLQVKIHIYISADGQITRSTIDSASGNDVYDEAVQSAIHHTDSLPPPPAALARTYAFDGIGIRFKPL